MAGLFNTLGSLLSQEAGTQQLRDSSCLQAHSPTWEHETTHGLRRTSSSAKREGKFPDLSTFMTTTPSEYTPSSSDAEYCEGWRHDLNTGQIIHVYDQQAINSRINNRVLVVLYQNAPWGMTCLSFCRHNFQAADPSIHWSVCAKGTAKATAAATAAAAAGSSGPTLSASPPASTVAAVHAESQLHPLEVVLQRGSTQFEPRPDITLNVRDHWYVEREINILTLGYVEVESMKALLNKYESMIHDRLEEARASLERPKHGIPVASGAIGPAATVQNARSTGPSNRVTKDIPNQRWIRGTRN